MDCWGSCAGLGYGLSRRRFLLAVLLASCSWLLVSSLDWRDIYLSDYLPYHPLQCAGAPGAAGLELIERLQSQGYQGFQVSYSTAGLGFDCAVGWGRREFPPEPVSLHSRFRYASVSKVFTAMVAQALVADGTIAEDTKLVEALGLHGKLLDARVGLITLGDLLRHRAGFARWEHDPMLVSDPWCPRAPDGLQYMRLDYPPHQKFAYSNLGYCLLGRALAKVMHEPERELIGGWLRTVPGGARSIDMVRRGGYLEGEVSLYPDAAERIDPLRDVDYASLVSVGGWLGNAADLRDVGKFIYRDYLSRFITGQLGQGDSDCEPKVLYGCHGRVFYLYQGSSGKRMFFHDGSLPGVTSFLGIFQDGSVLVFLANSRSVKERPNREVIKALYKFAN